MQLQCRICLTQSNNAMFDLKDLLQLETKLNISYWEALQQVTSSKVSLSKSLPSSICPICADLLKMAFQLIMQYKTTEWKLREMFNCQSDSDDSNNGLMSWVDVNHEKIISKPPVELIYKNKKFDVQELVIVRDEKPQACDFEGFLNNLGREVSATFTNCKRPKRNWQEYGELEEVSVAVKEENRFVPITEIQIDHASNQIEYIIEDTENTKDINELRVDGSNPESDEGNEMIEYIEIDSPHDVINDYIIDRSKRANKSKSAYGTNISEIKTDEGLQSASFQCEICQKIYSTWRNLSVHKRRNHFAKEDTFTCEICGMFCRSISAFIHHKLKHGEKRFKCELCNKAFFTKALLKVHQEAHANRRQYLCQVCGANFNYPNALIYHMRLHTGEKSYKCEFCQRTFRMPNSLIRHKRTHTNDRPYKCQYCDKRFRSRGEVKSHECIHTGHRPYSCPVCLRNFYKTHNMRVHMLSHEGPHRCGYCPRGLVSASLLALHARISHKGRSITTDIEECSIDEQSRGNKDSQGTEKTNLGIDEGGRDIEGDCWEINNDNQGSQAIEENSRRIDEIEVCQMAEENSQVMDENSQWIEEVSQGLQDVSPGLGDKQVLGNTKGVEEVVYCVEELELNLEGEENH